VNWIDRVPVSGIKSYSEMWLRSESFTAECWRCGRAGRNMVSENEAQPDFASFNSSIVFELRVIAML